MVATTSDGVPPPDRASTVATVAQRLGWNAYAVVDSRHIFAILVARVKDSVSLKRIPRLENNMNKIILTPLNANSLAHYQHEMTESEAFRHMMWDGEVNAKDKENDYFGWVNISRTDTVGDLPRRTMRVTRVTKVLGGSASRRHWNGTHSRTALGKDKNTLVLDCFYKDISYDHWLTNATKKDGTPYIDSSALHNGTKRFDWPF
jgi:hypothetical protein